MSYLDRTQIIELARKTREIDERPSVVLEPFYLRAFEKHAAQFPNDLNFIVELAQPGKPAVGGNGFGVATCLEDYCWVDIRLGADPNEKDGGKKHGFGSLWEYQNHCDAADHKKGRNERCAKTTTYRPTGGMDHSGAAAAAAPAPAAAVAGPSRAASTMFQPPPVDRKFSLPSRSQQSSSSSRTGSGASNILQPSHRHNMPLSSPSSRLDVKPSIPKSKSLLSMLDDDEVSVVRPEDVPMEFRKITNEANPYTLDDDDDDEPPAASSSRAAVAPSMYMPVSRFPQAKSEPIAGPSRPVTPIAVAPIPIYITAQNLPSFQSDVQRKQRDRDAHVRSAYSKILAVEAGVVNSAAVTNEMYKHAQILAGLLYASEAVEYPQLPQIVSNAQPSCIAVDNKAREKYEIHRQAAVELSAQLAAARAAGLMTATGVFLPPAAVALPAGIVNPYVPAIPEGLAGVAVAPVVLPNPLGLEGEELEDYHDRVYGERNPATGDLQAFFRDSIQDFSEDQDVDTARKVLGLNDPNQKFSDMTVTLMAHQVLGVAFMLGKEKDKRYMGGLLCDAMGLGKTVQTIATLVGNRSPDANVKTTLIVAPLAVLNQWKNEIESKTSEGTFKVLVHHGATRAKNTKQLRSADVVLTTYGTLTSEFAEPKQKKKKKKHAVSDSLPTDDDADEPVAKKKGPTFRVRWFRVVLDEAHMIRNKSTQASRAVADLDALHRWSLTGTLINNSLDDVFPHLRFLGISPQMEWAEFSKHIGQKAKKYPGTAAKRTQAILKTCMMRRHKDSELNGMRLLNLPPKSTTEVQLEFSAEERAIYDQVENRMRIRFGKFLKQGTVLKNMSCVLTMLMRLRQLTCHPWLLRRNPGDPQHPDDFVVSDEDLNISMNIPIVNAGADFVNACTILGEDWVADVKAKLQARYEEGLIPSEQEDEDKGTECSICLEMFDTETVVECKHSFCRSCLDDVFSTAPRDGGDLTDEQAARGQRKCPLCRAPIDKGRMFAAVAFFEPPKEAEEDEDVKMGEGLGSGVGADRKGKRKSLGDESDDDYDDNSINAKKGKGKAKEVEEDEDEDMELDEIKSVLPSTKMKVLGELVDEYLAEDGIKVIVFSEFVTYLKLVERFLDNKGISNRMYHGGMRNSDREDVVKEFTGPIKHDRSPRVMLISRKAGGAGLNLTAASKVISLDLAWNAASENQAVDRTHRIGQTRPVDVRRLIINNSVEQRILALQEKKSALADGAMGEGAGGRLGRLTVQDLMRLFNYDDD